MSLLLRFVSYVCSYDLFSIVERLRNKLLSYSVQRKLKSCGSNFNIAWPLTIKGGQYISVGDNFSCNKNARIDAIDGYAGQVFSPSIEIGDNVIINPGVHIGAIASIKIGNNVLLASGVFITDHSHGEISENAFVVPPSLRPLISKGGVVIEDNVWLGENVVILPNVRIESGAVIGANSVVTRSIGKNQVAAGVPAKVISKDKKLT